MEQTELISVRDLKVYFHSPEKVVRAVDGASFDLKKGEIMALVGESGCGKTLTALAITKLLPTKNCRVESGEIFFQDKNLLQFSDKELINIRGRDISYIFQEPAMALNPVFKVGEQIGEVIRLHNKNKEPYETVIKLLQNVGITPAQEWINSYPHQLSGGMKQRVMIAAAIAGKPQLLIADEPTTALDVTIQAQILQLLKKLQQEAGLAILFITHDISVAAMIADRICVMYAGEIAEVAQTHQFLQNPKHPYSQDLLKCLPMVSTAHNPLKTIKGSLGERIKEVTACRYSGRCDFEFDCCRRENVEMVNIADNHEARCLLYYK